MRLNNRRHALSKRTNAMLIKVSRSYLRHPGALYASAGKYMSRKICECCTFYDRHRMEMNTYCGLDDSLRKHDFDQKTAGLLIGTAERDRVPLPSSPYSTSADFSCDDCHRGPQTCAFLRTGRSSPRTTVATRVCATRVIPPSSSVRVSVSRVIIPYRDVDCHLYANHSCKSTNVRNVLEDAV